MCPESFGGVRFDIILCMSCFNHVPSGDTLRRDAVSSFIRICHGSHHVFHNETKNIITLSFVMKKLFCEL